jgi:hypothetical protein
MSPDLNRDPLSAQTRSMAFSAMLISGKTCRQGFVPADRGSAQKDEDIL